MSSQHSKEESGLSVHPLSFGETIGIIIGTNIGAGVLGLAYASRKAGFLPLLFWLMIAGVFTCITMLYVAEICMRTKGHFQLSGLARKYMGNTGAWLIFMAVAANGFGALIAYMSGSGLILNEFFGKYGISSAIGSLIFFVPAATVLFLGLKALGAAEKYISLGMVILVLLLVMATIIHKDVQIVYLWETQWQYMVPVFNLAVFCFAAQYMVPEMARGNVDTPKRLPKAIILGIFLTFILLSSIPAAVIALGGVNNLSEVATINWGHSLGDWAYYTANIFALLAMLTSYWGLGGSLFTNIFDHFKLGSDQNNKKRLLVLSVVTVPPFILAYSNLASFVGALYFAGTFGGVLMAIMPVIMLNQARKNGEIEPEWKCGWYASPIIQFIIVVLFLSSAVYAIASALGYLPAGW